MGVGEVCRRFVTDEVHLIGSLEKNGRISNISQR